MKSSYDTSVDLALDEVWGRLTDVDTVLAALPGVVLAREGSVVAGTVRCKLGSTQVTYRVEVTAELTGPHPHTATVSVTGSEVRGDGTIRAVLTVAAGTVGALSRVEFGGEIDATGRGAAADARSWAKVLESLLGGVLPEAEPAPARAVASSPAASAPTAGESIAPADPVFTAPVVSPHVAPEGTPAAVAPLDVRPPLAFGVVVLLVLFVLRRWRRRG